MEEWTILRPKSLTIPPRPLSLPGVSPARYRSQMYVITHLIAYVILLVPVVCAVSVDSGDLDLPDVTSYSGHLFSMSFQKHPVLGSGNVHIQVDRYHPHPSNAMGPSSDDTNASRSQASSNPPHHHQSSSNTLTTDLPDWLHYNVTSKTLQGVPEVKDKGQLLVHLVASVCQETSAVCVEKQSVFQINVIDREWDRPRRLVVSGKNSEPEPGSEEPDTGSVDHHQLSDTFSSTSSSGSGSSSPSHSDCSSGSSSSEDDKVISSLILCSSFKALPTRRRIVLVKNLARFLSLPETSVGLEPSSTESLKAVQLGFQMVSAGPGDGTDCGLAENVELVWRLPCQVVRRLSDFVKVMQHNVDVGRFQKETGLPVVGWYVASSNSLQTRKNRRRRRRRSTGGDDEGLRTAVPTPTLDLPQPSAVLMASSIQDVPTSSSQYTAFVLEHSSTGKVVPSSTTASMQASSSSVVLSLASSSQTPPLLPTSSIIATERMMDSNLISSVNDSSLEPPSQSATPPPTQSAEYTSSFSSFSSDVNSSSVSVSDSAGLSFQSVDQSSQFSTGLIVSRMVDSVNSSSSSSSSSSEFDLQGSQSSDYVISASRSIPYQAQESSAMPFLSDNLSISRPVFVSSSDITTEDTFISASVNSDYESSFSSSSSLLASSTPSLSEFIPSPSLDGYYSTASADSIDSSRSSQASDALQSVSDSFGQDLGQSSFSLNSDLSLEASSTRPDDVSLPVSDLVDGATTSPLQSSSPSSSSSDFHEELETDSVSTVGSSSSSHLVPPGVSEDWQIVASSSSSSEMDAAVSSAMIMIPSTMQGDIIDTTTSTQQSSAISPSQTASSSSPSSSLYVDDTIDPMTTAMATEGTPDSTSSSIASTTTDITTVTTDTADTEPTTGLTTSPPGGQLETTSEDTPSSRVTDVMTTWPSTVTANRRPVVEHPIGLIIGQQGRVLEMTIGRDVFYDQEDGHTDALHLRLELPSGEKVPDNFWLYLVTIPPRRRGDAPVQMLKGLPLPQDMDMNNASVVVLVATDSGGLEARDSIILQVNDSPRTQLTHKFTLRFAIDFQTFIHARDNIVQLMARLASHFDDSSPKFITVLEIRQGSFILVWTNNTLSGPVCQRGAIKKQLNRMMRKDGTVKSSFNRKIGRHLELLEIRYEPLGACIIPSTTTTLTTTILASSAAGTGLSVWAHIILPILIALVVFILILFLIFICNRRRKRREALRIIEKDAFSNERNPIIFPHEMDSDDPALLPKTPLVLPSDSPQHHPSSHHHQQQQQQTDPHRHHPRNRGRHRGDGNNSSSGGDAKSPKDRHREGTENHGHKPKSDKHNKKKQHHHSNRGEDRVRVSASSSSQSSDRPSNSNQYPEDDEGSSTGSNVVFRPSANTPTTASSAPGSRSPPRRQPPPYWQGQGHCPPAYRLPPPYTKDKEGAGGGEGQTANTDIVVPVPKATCTTTRV